ncbi:cell wall-active antibiotic response 4TMS protein YvqF [Nonomuraea fuscirosea]|jgi:hypothetical protein|uniref:Cell wall-active antibiotic response 4TMS protein YvqF n=1 Tax=Nonomuraea fuscirosea TaxID=1291556 RepID=A0A2T0NB09_9ACTN|nr:DUF1707 domain-containing protein [Nonomuraea fuscirosea]PRX70202.1 cell wall-active antibiotic response 4TMS protein YvqF [Nonomuraea fuscirosea]WSA54553.1 DUF1707 domain-containing protein [Nonomuraea fuscirosea]
MTDPGDVRASDAEREAVVEQLRVASVEGRLSLVELTDRTEAAYTATTHAELAMLTQDLPAGGTRAPVPAAPAEGRKRRWFVGVMGDSKRRGTWRIDQELGAVAVMGDVVLDLREAEVRTDRVEILAVSVMGDVKIIVPDGVNVDLDGMAIMGDKKVKVDQAPPGMNVPVVRVQAYAIMGDVKVVGDSHAQPLQRRITAWREHWRRLHGEDWRELSRQLRADTRELNRQIRDAHRDLGRGY